MRLLLWVDFFQKNVCVFWKYGDAINDEEVQICGQGEFASREDGASVRIMWASSVSAH